MLCFQRNPPLKSNSLLWLVVWPITLYLEDGIPGLGSVVIGSSPLKKANKKAIWKGNVALLKGIANHITMVIIHLLAGMIPLKTSQQKKAIWRRSHKPDPVKNGDVPTKKPQRPAIASLRSAYRHGQFLTTWCAVDRSWVMGWVVEIWILVWAKRRRLVTPNGGEK